MSRKRKSLESIEAMAQWHTDAAGGADVKTKLGCKTLLGVWGALSRRFNALYPDWINLATDNGTVDVYLEVLKIFTVEAIEATLKKLSTKARGQNKYAPRPQELREMLEANTPHDNAVAGLLDAPKISDMQYLYAIYQDGGRYSLRESVKHLLYYSREKPGSAPKDLENNPINGIMTSGIINKINEWGKANTQLIDEMTARCEEIFNKKGDE